MVFSGTLLRYGLMLSLRMYRYSSELVEGEVLGRTRYQVTSKVGLYRLGRIGPRLEHGE